MEEGEKEQEKEEGRKMEEGEKMLYKSGTVKLISAEGFEFIIDRKAAIVSNTLRNMLSSAGLCSDPSMLHFCDFSLF